ncbi:MAG: excinuclease ABC subunit UvrC [Methylococcaceae bacterium]
MLTIKSPQDLNPADIPTQTGVYLYKDANDTIIYCGKAKNLRARIKSYFSAQHLLPLKTRRLVAQIKQIEWIIVANEVEALLLENRLIKQHQPKYNILLKDAKTFAYIALTKDSFPRIFSTRKPTLKMDVFGAYTDNNLRYELQNMVIAFFKLRDCKTLPKKACLNFYINRCAAPCINNISQTEYATQVQQAKAFLSGDIKTTVQQLTEQMQKAADELQFERALELRNQLTRLQALQQKQSVDILNIKNQDVFAFYKQLQWLYITQFSVKKGVLLGKQTFKIENDAYSELEFLKAFYRKNPLPHEIMVNSILWQDDNDKTNIEAFFSQLRGSAVVLTLPQRGNKLALMQLAEKNSETDLIKNSALLDLQSVLSLNTVPRVIECFDISNLGNEHIVCGMTQFIDMKANKKGFRHFELKTLNQADDFASIYEAVSRRYSRLLHEQKTLPDLIMIDGGAGQVSAALEALTELNLSIALIGLAKKHEEIYLPTINQPLVFDKNNRMMLLLRKIRDATHDFAVSYNRKKRQMKLRADFKK